MKAQSLILLCEASLLTLWLANGEQWAKALLLSWLWTVEAGYVIGLVIIHFMSRFVPIPTPERDDRPNWFRHAILAWVLAKGLLLIAAAGHPLLGGLVIVTFFVARIDRHFRSEA